MRNIENKYVAQVREMADKVKACNSLYGQTMLAFDIDKDFYDGQGIRNAITEKAEELTLEIDQLLCELYDDWSGKSALVPNDFEDMDAYDEALGKIDDDNMAVAGVCDSFLACAGNVDIVCGFLPVNFMQEFIKEYGIFKLDKLTDYVEVA